MQAFSFVTLSSIVKIYVFSIFLIKSTIHLSTFKYLCYVNLKHSNIPRSSKTSCNNNGISSPYMRFYCSVEYYLVYNMYNIYLCTYETCTLYVYFTNIFSINCMVFKKLLGFSLSIQLLCWIKSLCMLIKLLFI